MAGTKNAVTGHYTSMIDPNNRYVGIGTFLNDSASFYNTTVAQFMGAGTQSEKVAKATGKCSAKIEASMKEITALKISGKKTLDRAQSASFALRAVLGNYGTSSYKILSAVKWTSSNPSVARVSSTGVVTGLKKGTAKITARLGSKSTTYTVSVTGKCVHSYTGKALKTATTKNNGKVVHTCKMCGYKRYVTVKAIKSVNLSKTSYKYDGKAKTPSVVVRDSDGKTVSAKYYKITYPKSRSKVGTYKVVITFSGRYSGLITRTFKIVK